MTGQPVSRCLPCDTRSWNYRVEFDDFLVIRPVTRELRAAKQEKETREAEKQRAREEREKKAAEKAVQKAEEAKMSPYEMFRRQENLDEYSAWNEKGIPIMMKNGKDEVPKSRRKKMEKEWEKQKILYDGREKV